MGQRLAVATAAHKLGINRHELQNLIRCGELQTFEGRIDIDELRQHFPLLSLDDSPMLERVRTIKATAFGRRVRERVVAPEPGDLETKLKRKTLEHDLAKAEAQRYREILEEMARILQQNQADSGSPECEVARHLSHWLAERLRN